MRLRVIEKIKNILTIIGILLILLPILLFALFMFCELFGMCVNHLATKNQTDSMRARLEKEISDITIIDVYSETDNTSGTGNHVECLSKITFSTEMQESEIMNRLEEYYDFAGSDCYITATDDGNYLFYFITSAPFRNNIEGH